MDNQNIYSKAGILILDRSMIDSATFEKIRQLLSYDEEVLIKKDQQLVDERMEVDTLTNKVTQLKFRVIEVKDEAKALKTNLDDIENSVAELMTARSLFWYSPGGNTSQDQQ